MSSTENLLETPLNEQLQLKSQDPLQTYDQFVCSDDERKAIECILDANGISMQHFCEASVKIRSIELFFLPFPRMLGLNFFTGLVNLELISQGIERIENLQHCPQLKSLNLSENRIERIDGVQRCTKLISLDLRENQIKKIENLESCCALTRLNLSANQLRCCESLSKLHHLVYLNLSQNFIDDISSDFAGLKNLKELNLANNLIGSFSQIQQLAVLKSVRTLYMSDPHYGDNPVCELCNYHTYALFHFTHLNILDAITISEETKMLAHSTYMKKKMFYNMCIKKAKRNATNIIRAAELVQKDYLGALNVVLRDLFRQKKYVEKNIDEQPYWSAAVVNSSMKLVPGAPIQHEKHEVNSELLCARELEKKFKALKDAVEVGKNEKSVSQADYNLFRENTKNESEQRISRLLIELETGGNVRFEEGMKCDSWFNSCVDLIHSRFNAEEFSTNFKLHRLDVTSVTRIHNRFLKNRFENSFPNLASSGEPISSNNLEYFFFRRNHDGVDGDNANKVDDGIDFNKIAELGFLRDKKSSDTINLNCFELLHDINSCEFDRIKALQKSDNNFSQRRLIKGGRLMITKVYLGPSTKAKTPEEIPVKNSPDNNTKVASSATDNLKKRKLLIEDECSMLPEFIVEFDFIRNTDSTIASSYSEIPSDQSCSETEYEDISSSVRERISLSRFCAKWSSFSHTKCSKQCSRALKMLPDIPQSKNISRMTRQVVVAQYGSEEWTFQTYLNLHGNSIKHMENLEQMTQLRVLILSFNEICTVKGIENLELLERLELDFNMIKSIEDNVKPLKNLRKLALNSNLLSTLDDITHLKTFAPKLSELNLSDNTVCMVKNYRSSIIGWVTQLQILDEIPVTRISIEESVKDTSWKITDSSLKASSFFDNTDDLNQRRIGSPRKQTISNTNEENECEWQARVVEIDLDHKKIRHIQRLEKFIYLRKASFCDNFISQMKGLEFNVNIEELALEENHISKISNIAHLKRLRKLELGSNKILHIENLDSLQNLVHLSIEDNEIQSLQGLDQLHCLMELYVGNNSIVDIKQLLQLRQLQNLVILDLSGNPVCRTTMYRLFVIFHLHKLKVLDGFTIEANEVTAAKSTYDGRLTEEFLVENVGHQFFECLQVLDLSNSRLRFIDAMEGGRFTSLNELNLSNNIISDITGLSSLSTLSILRLNHNKIEKFESGSEDFQFINLEMLFLGFNKITDISTLNLGNFTKLKVLSLKGNEIQKISGLDNLFQLRELNLDRNKIKKIDLNSFVRLDNLQELRLDSNSIRTLENLPVFPKLHTLSLCGNRLNDLSVHEVLSSIPFLVELSMNGNPVSRNQIYRPTLVQRIPALRMVDGREVSNADRQRASMLFQSESSSLVEDESPTSFARCSSMRQNLDMISHHFTMPSILGNEIQTSMKHKKRFGQNSMLAVTCQAVKPRFRKTGKKSYKNRANTRIFEGEGSSSNETIAAPAFSTFGARIFEDQRFASSSSASRKHQQLFVQRSRCVRMNRSPLKKG